MLAAGLGLSAVLATSAVAYHTIRWAGALYLVYLGVRIFRFATDETDLASRPTGNAFAQAIVTEVLNPKTALFSKAGGRKLP